ncbi:hypothetical protein D9M70_544780 [compost metagenome]
MERSLLLLLQSLDLVVETIDTLLPDVANRRNVGLLRLNPSLPAVVIHSLLESGLLLGQLPGLGIHSGHLFDEALPVVTPFLETPFDLLIGHV